MGMNKFLVVGGGLTDPTAPAAITAQTVLDSNLVGNDLQDSTALGALSVDSATYIDSANIVILNNLFKTYAARIKELVVDVAALRTGIVNNNTAINSIDSKLLIAN